VQDEEFWAARFEEHRPRLRAVAYRMLGSFAEAEDAVQEAWLRVSRASGEDVANVGGWLTTVVSRDRHPGRPEAAGDPRHRADRLRHAPPQPLDGVAVAARHADHPAQRLGARTRR
jgi:hypothetical protein